MRVWSCASWATTQCNGPLISDNLLGAWIPSHSTFSATGVTTPSGPGSSLIENTDTNVHEMYQQPQPGKPDLYGVYYLESRGYARCKSLYIGRYIYQRCRSSIHIKQLHNQWGVPNTTGGFTYSAASASSLGGGWCQGSVTFSPHAASGGNFYTSLVNAGSTNYAGNGSSGIQMYPATGPQLKITGGAPVAPAVEKPGPSAASVCVAAVYLHDKSLCSDGRRRGIKQQFGDDGRISLAYLGFCDHPNADAGNGMVHQHRSRGRIRSRPRLSLNKGGNLAGPTGYLVYRCTTMPFAFSAGALTGEGAAVS